MGCYPSLSIHSLYLILTFKHALYHNSLIDAIRSSLGVQSLEFKHFSLSINLAYENNSSTARCSMEMSGLGKMKPNMLLIGFKNNWQSSLTEARDYYKIIQTAFDMKLSVGVLRIPGINLQL